MHGKKFSMMGLTLIWTLYELNDDTYLHEKSCGNVDLTDVWFE